MGELFGGVNLFPVPWGMENGGFQGAVLGRGNETKGEVEMWIKMKREGRRRLKIATTETWSCATGLSYVCLALLHSGSED